MYFLFHFTVTHNEAVSWLEYLTTESAAQTDDESFFSAKRRKTLCSNTSGSSFESPLVSQPVGYSETGTIPAVPLDNTSPPTVSPTFVITPPHLYFQHSSTVSSAVNATELRSSAAQQLFPPLVVPTITPSPPLQPSPLSSSRSSAVSRARLPAHDTGYSRVLHELCRR